MRAVSRRLELIPISRRARSRGRSALAPGALDAARSQRCDPARSALSGGAPRLLARVEHGVRHARAHGHVGELPLEELLVEGLRLAHVVGAELDMNESVCHGFPPELGAQSSRAARAAR